MNGEPSRAAASEGAMAGRRSRPGGPLSLARALILAGLAAALSVGLASAGALGAPQSPGSSRPVVADGDAPVQSVVLVLQGETLAERFRTLAGPAPTAEEAVARARLHAKALDAAERDLLRRQAAVAAAAESRGARVVGRYRHALNGLLVHARSSVLPALAEIPGVRAIEPAPRVRLELSRSVPRIGAPELAQQLGYDGRGSIVAVIDSGIDYTHAHVGGPGDPTAYAAAAGAAERIDDTWQDRPLFPTERVLGGWDFVGPRYTHPNYCTEALAQEGRCSNRPEPDPDPLDQHNHGTHVAGIVAGRAVAGLGDGVAPGASLVALKIYGTPRGLDVDEEVDVVLDALDWCAGVNLGRHVPGIAPERVDVVNMSLGEPFGQGSRLFEEAIGSLAETLGVVVVASAGNAGNRPYVLNAPSAALHALSVASVSVGAGASDTLSDFSARGPGKNGHLKPDLSAPGGAIVSAARGSGTGGSSSSGTSMASPHVAGAAAVLAQRNRMEGLGLSAGALGMLLKAYAGGEVLRGGEPAGVSRQGAGRLDLLAAGTASLLVTTEDFGSLYLGALALSGDRAFERRVSVRNLGDAPRWVQPSVAFTTAEDGGSDLAVSVEPDGLALAPGESADFRVSFQIKPQDLPGWNIGLHPAPDPARMDQLELDGRILLTPYEDRGSELPVGPVARVPFQVLPRRASDIRPVAAQAPMDALTPGYIRLVNGGFSGWVEVLYPPDGQLGADPDEALVSHELDLRQVGLRFDAAPGQPANLVLGLALHAPAPVPQVTVLEVYLDTDRDGRDDYRARVGAQSVLNGRGTDDRMVLRVAPWDAAAAAWGVESDPIEVPSDLHTRVRVLRIPLALLGMAGPAPFDFYLVHRAATEDWLRGPGVDVAPDGADLPGGPRYGVDPTAWGWMPEPSAFSLLPDMEGDLPLHLVGEGGPRPFLLLFPHNDFASPDAQLALVDPGRGIALKSYLPALLRNW